jgi:hypothetical protein
MAPSLYIYKSWAQEEQYKYDVTDGKSVGGRSYTEYDIRVCRQTVMGTLHEVFQYSD